MKHFLVALLALFHSNPFDDARTTLYTRDELLAGYDANPALNKSLDWAHFEYFKGAHKYSPDIAELRAQRSHDAGMDLAINDFFGFDLNGAPTKRKPIVMMGSHSVLRSATAYKDVAHLGFELTHLGYFVISGGGPGLMEAIHLGAYMSAYSLTDLDTAIAVLAKSSEPKAASKKQFQMPDYWQVASEVLKRYPNGADSLGIPTWFYGHEGANAFSTLVAKYFSNSLREEKLCSLGLYGTIFVPGGPGSMQEVFMIAAENAYASYGWYRPMVFYQDAKKADEMSHLILDAASPGYRALGMVGQAETPADIVKFIAAHPPVHEN